MIWTTMTVVSGGGVAAAAAAAAAAQRGGGAPLPLWLELTLLGILVVAGAATIWWIWRNR